MMNLVYFMGDLREIIRNSSWLTTAQTKVSLPDPILSLANYDTFSCKWQNRQVKIRRPKSRVTVPVPNEPSARAKALSYYYEMVQSQEF